MERSHKQDIMGKRKISHIRTVIIALAVAIALPLQAQDDVEYRMELGAVASMTAYQGDFSHSLTKKMNPGGGVVFRAILNPHMAVRIQGMYTQLKGGSDGVDNYYPEAVDNGNNSYTLKKLEYDFKTNVGDLSFTYEYNFWPYGTGKDYRGAKRVTPFVSLGLGMTFASCSTEVVDHSESLLSTSSSKSVFTANIPLGLGVKYKMGARTNLSFDWQIHFSLSDKLDGIKDPYTIGSSGLFKNTDCYSTFSLALTYSLSPKCPTCHKQ